MVTPPLHPASSVNFCHNKAHVDCVIHRATTVKYIAALVKTMQTYDINSHDRPVDTKGHQRKCLVAATATTVGSTMTAGKGRALLSHGGCFIFHIVKRLYHLSTFQCQLTHSIAVFLPFCNHVRVWGVFLSPLDPLQNIEMSHFKHHSILFEGHIRYNRSHIWTFHWYQNYRLKRSTSGCGAEGRDARPWLVDIIPCGV